jgi:hypothetical protein
MLLDRHLARWDVRSRHEIMVNASASETYRATRDVDLGNSIPVVALFAVRAVPHLLTGKAEFRRELTLDSFSKLGFVVLEEEVGQEVVIGAVGKFWRPDSGLIRIEPRDFDAFDEPGYAKGALNFIVEDRGPTRTLLATETRVLCTDDRARRRFGLYWRLIGPFSGVIRHMLLREAKLRAE